MARLLLAVAATALLHRGDFVLFLIAAPGLAVWMLVRAWTDGARSVGRDGSRLRWLAVDVATAAALLTAGSDRLQNELREAEPAPGSIAGQAVGAFVLCLLLLSAVWALGGLSSWWRQRETEEAAAAEE